MSKQSSTLQIFPVHFQNIEAVRATAFWRTTIKVVAFHDTLLRTEKPPYRFPHTAAECLFAEQVAVCAGAGQRQHQNMEQNRNLSFHLSSFMLSTDTIIP